MIYAVGDNPAASRLAGVRMWQVLLFVYAICGAALGAARASCSSASTTPPTSGIGAPFLLPSVAAVVIGGTSIFGGLGGYAGTILGALILTVLDSLLTILNASQAVRQIIYGLIVLALAAIYARCDRRRMTLEVLTVGRVSVDLYPEQTGVTLAEVRTFRKMLGGSPTNVAVAAARLGRRAAVVTKVGADGFGDYIRAALGEFGVDASFVGTDPVLRTPLAFCEIHPPDDFPLLFYRQPTAPDLQLVDADLDAAPVDDVPLLWMTGTGLSEEPSRSATLAALRRARRPRAHRLRPRLPPDALASTIRRRSTARRPRSRRCSVGNREEWAVLGEARRRRASSSTIEKLGRKACAARAAARSVDVPPIDVEVVNGLGAGDAFGGRSAMALLAGWALERTLRFANAAGALVASRLGCADDMPIGQHEGVVMRVKDLFATRRNESGRRKPKRRGTAAREASAPSR